MSTSLPAPADDVRSAVRLTVATLRQALDRDWEAKAGSLEWTCWETVEHIADNLFFHAAQLGPGTPAADQSVPFAWARHRPGAGHGRVRRWPTLLWATGRAELPGHPRPADWDYQDTESH
jgi:hypothetical protein